MTISHIISHPRHTARWQEMNDPRVSFSHPGDWRLNHLLMSMPVQFIVYVEQKDFPLPRQQLLDIGTALSRSGQVRLVYSDTIPWEPSKLMDHLELFLGEWVKTPRCWLVDTLEQAINYSSGEPMDIPDEERRIMHAATLYAGEALTTLGPILAQTPRSDHRARREVAAQSFERAAAAARGKKWKPVTTGSKERLASAIAQIVGLATQSGSPAELSSMATELKNAFDEVSS